jgi:DNA-binding NtrC family response regulator
MNGSLIFFGEKMHRIRELIDQVANTDVTVLIEGESGVGKEIVARALHLNSPRRDKPFIKVNGAALP